MKRLTIFVLFMILTALAVIITGNLMAATPCSTSTPTSAQTLYHFPTEDGKEIFKIDFQKGDPEKMKADGWTPTTFTTIFYLVTHSDTDSSEYDICWVKVGLFHPSPTRDSSGKIFAEKKFSVPTENFNSFIVIKPDDKVLVIKEETFTALVRTRGSKLIWMPEKYIETIFLKEEK